MKKITDEQLEKIVQAYQQGDEKAAEDLLQAYKAYFQKFINLIKHGKLNLADRTSKKFLRCFLSKEERENLKKWVKSKYIQQKLNEKTEMIRSRLYFLHEDELLSEMVILLLEMAKGHDGSNFRTYVSSYFPLNLAKRLILMMKKQQEYDESTIQLTDNIVEASCEDEYNLDEDKPVYYIRATEPTLFDENWINGYTCGEPFADLTPYERRILKLYYEWKTIGLRDKANGNRREIPNDLYESLKARLKKTEEDIAELLGCSRKTINTKRNEIKQKVEELALDLRLIKG
jgi:DNA-binding XRE family transcriptional regulator